MAPVADTISEAQTDTDIYADPEDNHDIQNAWRRTLSL